MIKINKPTQGPESLRKTGAKALTRLREMMDLEPGRSLASKDFKGHVYGSREVRDLLGEIQHGKCCYCEKPSVECPEVEHYRPKTGWGDDQGKLQKPGYWWLAYEWTNLVLACDKCNGLKGNAFPLAPNGNRCIRQGDSLADEKPLLINPAEDDPTHFIFFRSEVPLPKPGLKGLMRQKAQTTIQLLKLACHRERPRLFELRRGILKTLVLFCEILERGNSSLPPEMLKEISQKIKDMVADEAPFAAMCRSYMVTRNPIASTNQTNPI